MSKRWEERVQAIMSGVSSTMRVCEDEYVELKREAAEDRRQKDISRNALETVIANLHVAPADNDVVMQALRAAAPGHPSLKGA